MATRVRKLLKMALRAYGLRCVEALEIKLDHADFRCNNKYNEVEQTDNERSTPRSAEASAIPERRSKGNGRQAAKHDEIHPPRNIATAGPGRQTRGAFRHRKPNERTVNHGMA